MTDHRDELIPIGEFARLCELSVKMLRHYHDLGLLQPASVDPATGYRYYRPEQTARAAVIRELRQLNMPLGEIHRLLEATDTDEAKAILARHHERLIADAGHAQRRLALIQRFLTEEHAMLEQITDTQLPALHVATRRFAGPIGQSATLGTTASNELLALLQRDAIDVAGPAVLLVHHADEERFEMELCLPVAKDARAGDDVPIRDLEPARAAVTRHVGPWEDAYLTVQSLIDWARVHGHTPALPYRAYLLAFLPAGVGVAKADAVEPVCDYAVAYR